MRASLDLRPELYVSSKKTAAVVGIQLLIVLTLPTADMIVTVTADPLAPQIGQTNRSHEKTMRRDGNMPSE
jgi:hypothetical protein